MPLNKQTFITRTLTAIVFAAVMLLGLLWNHWSFFILFSVIHFGCWWEYLKLTEKIYATVLHIYTKLGVMLMGYGIMLLFCGPMYVVGGYSIKENFSLPVSAAGFILLISGIFQKHPLRMKAVQMAALGVLYISLSWGLMLDLYGIKTGNPIIMYEQRIYLVFFPMIIILTMWINDTMAYLVGSLIGKTPFSKISPKKTWEGTIGGILLASFLVGGFASMNDDWFVFGQTFSFWIILAGVAAIAGTFGDLLESKLKRMAGVKDSGSIMPGHGGFLDRFDSLLLATPAVWLFVKLLMN